MKADPKRPNAQRHHGRKAKIVATLGPSSNTPQAIGHLLQEGVDVVRLNFSHGSHEEHANLIKIAMMARIIERTESSYHPGLPGTPNRRTSTMSIAEAACAVADKLHTQAIAVLTTRGMTARLVSTARPLSPIVAFTRRESLARQVSLYWGVEPKVLEFNGNTEPAISQVCERLLLEGIVTPRGLMSW